MQSKVVRVITVMFVLVALITLCSPIMAQGGGQGRGGGDARGGGGGQGRGGGGRGPQTPPLLMTTTAFEDGSVIPDKYTQKAGPMAVSPELKWSQVPMGTQTFVLLMHDPDAIPDDGIRCDQHAAVAEITPPLVRGRAQGVGHAPAADQGRLGPTSAGKPRARGGPPRLPRLDRRR